MFSDPEYGDNPDVSLALNGKKIIESYNAMGWTALGLGERDFALGTNYLKDLAKMADFPLSSANVFDKETNKYVFKPYTVVKMGGLRVGITAVIGNEVGFSADRQDKDGIYVGDPASSLGSVIEELKKKSDFIIVLAHTGVTDAKVLAQEYDSIDLMIVGHGGEVNIFQPVTEKNSLITTLYSRGKYIDRLDFKITAIKHPYDIFVEGSNSTTSFESQELLLRKQQLQVFMADIDAQKKQGKDMSSMEKLVTDEMAQVDAKLEKLQGESTKDRPNTVKATLIALDTSYADDPTIRDIIKKYADELIKIKEQQKQSQLGEWGGSPPGVVVEPHYVGMANCKGCHTKIYDFVEGTKHVKAYETLREKERQFEPDCIGCHTTGFNKPGGFTNVLAADNLLGVQCEDCHGPGSLHITDNKKYRMQNLTAEANCVTCHTPDNDNNFVYAEKLKKIKCPVQ